MLEKIKVYAFVGPSGTGKSYRAQMVAAENDIHFIIDDGLLIKDNEVIAGNSAKKAATKIETVKKASDILLLFIIIYRFCNYIHFCYIHCSPIFNFSNSFLFKVF